MSPTILIAAIALAVLVFVLISRHIDANPVEPAVRFGPVDLRVADNWEIGSIINGQNYSLNMPLHPTPTPDGWAIELPRPECQPHYVTTLYGSLKYMTRITIKGHVEGKIVGKDGVNPSAMTLYFQRQGDDWSAVDAMSSYRWWHLLQSPIAEGLFDYTVNLSDVWTNVWNKSGSDLPAEFKAAVDNAGRVGFTLGAVGDGYGHGVMAHEPAKITITSFTVE